MSDINIRKYQPSDREAVLTISADTAFFGEPVEAFLEDRRLYNDAFALYYVDYESEYAWVAEISDGVIGFLFGCADTQNYLKHWKRYLFSKVFMNALAGKYKIGERTSRFAIGMLIGSIRGEDPAIDLTAYPAHLQIDIRYGYRGLGAGFQLIEAYLGQLRRAGIPGVHLQTTSHNVVACHLYEKNGFRLLASRPNRFWTRMIGEKINNLSYGLKLGGGISHG